MIGLSIHDRCVCVWVSLVRRYFFHEFRGNLNLVNGALAQVKGDQRTPLLETAARSAFKMADSVKHIMARREFAEHSFRSSGGALHSYAARVLTLAPCSAIL